MINQNINYDTLEISRYFKENRINWDQFYDSEKHVLEYISPKNDTEVLDIGCGCGGLGLALNQRFGIWNYTGIEINNQAAKEASRLYPNSKIINGDFLKLLNPTQHKFSLVTSLSCIDWNIEFKSMLDKAWLHVSGGGTLIISLRLTKEKGINDISKSFQFINYSGKKEGTIAPYIVLNHDELINKISSFNHLNSLYGFGYKGKPSPTAVTPYHEIFFGVYALTKNTKKFAKNKPTINLNYDL